MPSKPRETIKGKIKTASGDKNAEAHGDVAIEARRRFCSDSVYQDSGDSLIRPTNLDLDKTF